MGKQLHRLVRFADLIQHIAGHVDHKTHPADPNDEEVLSDVPHPTADSRDHN
jgi:hypothetical protein